MEEILPVKIDDNIKMRTPALKQVYWESSPLPLSVNVDWQNIFRAAKPPIAHINIDREGDGVEQNLSRTPVV